MLAKTGTLEFGNFGDKSRNCYKMSVEANQSFNTTFEDFDTFLLSAESSNEHLTNFEFVKDSACSIINENLDLLKKYAENTLWACSNSGYTPFTRGKGSSKTWKTRIESNVILKIRKWTRCNG